MPGTRRLHPRKAVARWNERSWMYNSAVHPTGAEAEYVQAGISSNITIIVLTRARHSLSPRYSRSTECQLWKRNFTCCKETKVRLLYLSLTQGNLFSRRKINVSNASEKLRSSRSNEILIESSCAFCNGITEEPLKSSPFVMLVHLHAEKVIFFTLCGESGNCKISRDFERVANWSMNFFYGPLCAELSEYKSLGNKFLSYLFVESIIRRTCSLKKLHSQTLCQ